MKTANERVTGTFLRPFRLGEIDFSPEGGAEAFWIRAAPSKDIESAWKQTLICEQTLGSQYSRLQKMGFKVTRNLTGKFDLGFCTLTKHKKENLGNIARAMNLLRPSATLLCCGEKAVGPKTIAKAVAERVAIAGQLSKNHCRVFWFTEDPSLDWNDWELHSKPARYLDNADYLTRPGIFSYDKMDKGSRFLIEHFPNEIAGQVADYGSGWGYLAGELLQRFRLIESLHLWEDEWIALDLARKNLARFGDRAEFFWSDLTQQESESRQRYDWIITNPPFHAGTESDIRLGCRFMERASHSLKPSGKLLMVANRHLPYEKPARQLFASVEIRAESTAFKVLEASGPQSA